METNNAPSPQIHPIQELVILDVYYKALRKVPELKAKALEAKQHRAALYKSMPLKFKLWYHYAYLALPYFRIKEYIKSRFNKASERT